MTNEPTQPAQAEESTAPVPQRQEGAGERTFTQTEANEIIERRVARVKATPPVDYDELKAKVAATSDYDDLKAEVEALKAERAKAAEVAKAAKGHGVDAGLLGLGWLRRSYLRKRGEVWQLSDHTCPRNREVWQGPTQRAGKDGRCGSLGSAAYGKTLRCGRPNRVIPATPPDSSGTDPVSPATPRFFPVSPRILCHTSGFFRRGSTRPCHASDFSGTSRPTLPCLRFPPVPHESNDRSTCLAPLALPLARKAIERTMQSHSKCGTVIGAATQ